MSKIIKNEIICKKCGKIFPNYGIIFCDTDILKSSILQSNTVKCPHCANLTLCTKENMLITTKEGTFNASTF